MNRKRIYLHQTIPADIRSDLESRFDMTERDPHAPADRQKLYEQLRDAEGILGGIAVDRNLLANAPKLRAVSSISVGYNNFDLPAMKEHRVLGLHTPGVLDDTVADLAMALMLAAARRVPEMDRLVRAGDWKKGDDSPMFGLDVHHRTLGIIGMGRIGETLAKRAALGFDMQVLYHTRTRRTEAEDRLGLRYAELNELLSASDFVVLLTPLTPETQGMMNAGKFALMRKTGIFINISRGQTVVEPDLVEALRSGTIWAAGLDVFEKEPVPADHPLLSLPNVVALPHLGSATADTRWRMARLAADNLIEALETGRCRCVVPELADLQAD